MITERMSDPAFRVYDVFDPSRRMPAEWDRLYAEARRARAAEATLTAERDEALQAARSLAAIHKTSLDSALLLVERAEAERDTLRAALVEIAGTSCWRTVGQHDRIAAEALAATEAKP